MKRPILTLASFYLIVNVTTAAILAGVAYILLSMTRFLTSTIAIAFGGILAFYVLIHSASSVFLARLAGDAVPLPMIGWAAGRLLGAVTGFVLGARIAGIPGAVIGAIALYFLGRSLGAALATRVASLLGPLFKVPQLEPLQLPPPSLAHTRGLHYVLFSIPAIYILAAALIVHFEIRSSLDPSILTIFRVLLYPAGIALIGLPWIGLKGPRPSRSPLRGLAGPPFGTYLPGTAMSASPAFLGTILFVAGASTLELAIACAIALAASTAWLLNKRGMPSAA